MLFERFMSKERAEAPDIDVDFEHERREEVLQYLYGKYGRERAGMAAKSSRIGRARRSAMSARRSACRWTASIALAKRSKGHRTETVRPSAARAVGIDPRSPIGIRLIDLVSEILGFPRHCRSTSVGWSSPGPAVRIRADRKRRYAGTDRHPMGQERFGRARHPESGLLALGVDSHPQVLRLGKCE